MEGSVPKIVIYGLVGIFVALILGDNDLGYPVFFQ